MESTTVEPMNNFDPDLVDRVRKALAGTPREPEKQEVKNRIQKIDGRTKAYKDAVKRISTRNAKKVVTAKEELTVDEVNHLLQEGPFGRSVMRPSGRGGGIPAVLTDQLWGKMKTVLAKIGVDALATLLKEVLPESELNRLKQKL